MIRGLFSCSLCLGFLVVAGCGGGATGGSDKPDTVAVSGSVTLDGSPIAEAQITFVPDSDTGNGATGKTDESGKFTMSTFSGGDGAVPGKYRVKIVKFAASKQSASSGDMSDPNYSGEEDTFVDTDTGEDPSFVPDVESTIPQAYADEGQSGLSADITEATSELKFELTSK